MSQSRFRQTALPWVVRLCVAAAAAVEQGARWQTAGLIGSGDAYVVACVCPAGARDQLRMFEAAGGTAVQGLAGCKC
jgi:hypothetical protein